MMAAITICIYVPAEGVKSHLEEHDDVNGRTRNDRGCDRERTLAVLDRGAAKTIESTKADTMESLSSMTWPSKNC